MKILRVRRQKKENKIYESRVFVSIFLTSLDPPRKYDKLVKTQLNTSPDKSLQVYQVSSKIECVHYFKLNKNILLYMKYINTIIPTYMHTHTHTHAHTRTHTVCLCVLCGSQNKQRLFPYTALTDWFL